MQEMEEWRVQSLGQEDPAGGGQGKATHSSVLTWRILWTEELVGYIVHGVTRSWTWLKWLGMYLLLGMEFTLGKMEKFWKMDSGDGYTTLWMH